MFLIPFITPFLFLIIFFIYRHYREEIKRAYYLNRGKSEIPFIKESTKDFFPLINPLSETQKNKLYRFCVIFIYEKRWNCKITKEQRAQEALKACLPILKKKTNFYPQITEITISRTFRQWLELHERQFQIEMGKENFFLFKKDFPIKSEQYFINPEELEKNEKTLYQLLHNYYSPS